MKIILAIFSLSNLAFGWGSYGHQQISLAAIELAKTTPIGKCFVTNIKTVQRYAVTPDIEWKGDPAIKSREGDLHWFELDAFLRRPIDTAQVEKLPNRNEYAQVAGENLKLLKQNLEQVLAMVDAAKKTQLGSEPKPEVLKLFGSAPWRAFQLYQEAVNALSKVEDVTSDKDPQFIRALLALGTLSHYVGDMGQPFHVTLNYDGGYQLPTEPFTAHGIHAAFESLILEQAAKLQGAKQEKPSQLWSHFDATQPAVLKYAEKLAAKELEEAKIVAAIIEVGGRGYKYADPLVHEFNEARIGELVGAATNRDEAIKRLKVEIASKKPATSTSIADFRGRALKDADEPTGTISVLNLANKRMADSAVLLSRIWKLAGERALLKNPKLAQLADCKAIPYSAAYAKKGWLAPDFF